MAVRHRRGRVAAGAAALALLTSFAACGGDDDEDDAAPTTESETDSGATATTAAGADAGGDAAGDAGGGGAVTYEVTEVAYTDVEAPAGSTIEVVNSSGVPHTFTADDGSFDASFGPDESAEVTAPGEPGEYPFHCEIHSSMTATLTVS